MNTYEKRGVSSTKKDVHQAIKHLDKGLFPKAFCKILPDYLTGSEEHCIIMHADTAGTKSSLAYMYWKETGDLSVWKGIVQDAIVMNIDDMACSGCIDNFIVSATLGRNKNLVTGDVVATIIQYAEEFSQQLSSFGIRMHLAGGETADVGDIVRTADVGYTVFGRIKKTDVIEIQPQPGDVVVGFASYGQASYEDEYNSGMGCNGLTSARHDIFSSNYKEKYPETFDPSIPDDVCYIGKRKIDDKINVDGQHIDYGKLVLSPTRTYLPLLKSIIDNISKNDIHGIIHNTGGGQYKINHFIANNVLIHKNNLLPIPPLFKIIHEDTGTPYAEMFKVFNMGMRLEVYTPSKKAAEDMIALSEKFNIDAQIIGEVESAETPGVKISHEGNSYFVPSGH
jgi:phosphoribosylformylglycinamidine cyclo-ligase